MDLSAILVGALASSILKQLVEDIARHPRFDPLRNWLSGRSSQLVVEAALAYAVNVTAQTDAKRGSPMLDWSYLTLSGIVDELTKALYRDIEASIAEKGVTAIWARHSPLALCGVGEFETLASILVHKYKHELGHDRVYRAMIFADGLESALAVLTAEYIAEAQLQEKQLLQKIEAALRQIAMMWGNPPLCAEQTDLLDMPFAVRIDLDRAIKVYKRPYTLYPGEQAIVLLEGQTVELRGPGPLPPNMFRERTVPLKGRKLLEAVIYRTNELDIPYNFEVRSKTNEQVIVDFTLRFHIENVVRLHPALVRGKFALTLRELRDQLKDAVRVTIQQFVRGKTFAELNRLSNAPELLEMALEREFDRPVHLLNERGLRFCGVIGWKHTNPPAVASQPVIDLQDTETAVLKAKVRGLEKKVPLLKRYVELDARRKELQAKILPNKANESSFSPWRFPTEGSNQEIDPIRSRAVIGEGVVYMADRRGTVYCLDLTTGQETDTWSRCVLPDRVDGGLILANVKQKKPDLLVPCLDGNLYLIHSTTGKQLDVYHTDGRLESTPLIAQGCVYLGCTVRNDWGGVVALRLGDGSIFGKWNTSKKHAVPGTPVVVGQMLYFTTSDWNGESVFVADAHRSGEATLIYKTKGMVVASPVVDQARRFIYLACEAGSVYALDFAGKKVWQRDLGAPIRCTGAVVGNRFYVGDQKGYLHALDLDEEGRIAWSQSFADQGPITTTPVAYDEWIIFGSRGGNVFVVNAITGGLFGSFPTEGQVIASPVVTKDGIILVGCSNQSQGVFYAQPWHLGQRSAAV